jgi:predicted DNA-binding protein with PD1-like motif
VNAAAPTLLQHPGPRLTPRVQTVTTRSAAVHATLSPGVRLIDGLAEILGSTDATCAQVEITGGIFDRISYCVPAECPDGSVVATFSETREARTPAQLLAGSVTVGFRNGERFMHCHAMWLDAEGEIQGGHLWPETVVGGVPVHVVVHPLPGISTVNARDPETCMPVFTPHYDADRSDEPSPVRGSRVAMSRVRPGEDITAAIRQVCVEQGFRAAVVRAGVGSLVGACLRRGHDVFDVDGPATELATIAGRVRPDTADVELSAIVVDRHGDVHAGVLVPGRNPVAITFELLIFEDDECS